MLSDKAIDSVLKGADGEGPSPSLGQYVQRRHRPPMERPYEGPFRETTAAAVSERTGGFGSHAAQRLSRMRQGVEATAPMTDIDAAGESIPADSPAWSVSLTDEEVEPRDEAIPVWREVLAEQRSARRPSAAAPPAGPLPGNRTGKRGNVVLQGLAI